MAGDVERFGSGGPWEEQIGYSRVVRAGSLIFVSGCTAVGDDGQIVGGASAYEQAREAIARIAAAVEQAGATLEDVVQTRMYLTDAQLWEEVGRAHREAFGAHPPTATLIEVQSLLDPRMLVEIDATAFAPPT